MILDKSLRFSGLLCPVYKNGNKSFSLLTQKGLRLALLKAVGCTDEEVTGAIPGNSNTKLETRQLQLYLIKPKPIQLFTLWFLLLLL